MKEIWKDIANFEGLYEVSNLGRIKSLPKNRGIYFTKEEILKGRVGNGGYLQAILCHSDGTRKSIKFHRIVAETFIENPEDKKTVNHKDGVKTHNGAENLEWNTHGENIRHAFKIGLSNNNYVKKKVSQIKDNKVIKIWESATDAKRKLGVCNCAISRCCKGELKQTGGFQWKFA